MVRSGPLFDWFASGEVAWDWNGVELRTAQATKDFVQTVYAPEIGAMVVGRYVFDQTDGWDGQAIAGDHVFVVTHEAPTSWEFADTAPFTFVTDGVESAVAQVRDVAGDRRGGVTKYAAYVRKLDVSAGRQLGVCQPRQQAALRPTAAYGLGAQRRPVEHRQADDAVARGAAVAKCRYRRRDSDPLR